MAFQDLALPIDIPWKRLAASSDMVDRSYGDRRFPPRWRSSIAVFFHEPDELPEEYCERTITYLKLVCTITGYQVGEEVGATPFGDDAWHSEHRKLGDLYHPCYGAMVQVAVFPTGGDLTTSLADYPYIADFEPKRRELYEAVTQSGEILGRSASTLNVRKGTTSAESTEYSSRIGAEVKGVYKMVGGSIEAEHSWGGGTHVEEENVRTKDDSREKRETFSSSTSLTQMYELFTGYHLGSNRALFSMVARPHTTEMKDQYTFVNGPRRLEGLQEIFLIVNRPKHVPGVCVEAFLETAHLVATEADPAPAITDIPSGSYEDMETIVGMSDRWENPSGEPGETKDFAQVLFQLPANCVLDTSRGGQSFTVDDINDPTIKYTVTGPAGLFFGFKPDTFWRSIKALDGGVTGSEVSAKVTLKGLGGHGGILGAQRGPERFNADVTVYYRCPKAPELTPPGGGDGKTLFLTSRGVGTCIQDPGAQETSQPTSIDPHIYYAKVFAAENRKKLFLWLEKYRVIDFDEDQPLSSEDYLEKLEDIQQRNRRKFRDLVRKALQAGTVEIPNDWRRPEEWISFESSIPVDAALEDPTAPASVRIRAANDLGAHVGEVMAGSLRSSERYADGEIDFWHSRIALAEIGRAFRLMATDDPENLPVASVEVPYREELLEVFGENVRRRDIVVLPTVELARSLDVPHRRALEIRARLMDPTLRPDEDRLKRFSENQMDETQRARTYRRWLPRRRREGGKGERQ